MKKILFLINSMPATFSANVLCDERIIAEIKKDNHVEIHCLCYKQHENDKSEEVRGNVYIHRIKDKAMILHVGALENPQQGKSKKIHRFQKIIMRVKQATLVPIYPIYEPFRILRLFHYAKKLQLHIGLDMIVAEHNGLDTLIAGFLMKRWCPHIKFVPIFWDSLAGGFYAKYLPKNYAIARRCSLEKRILVSCDNAIMMQSHEAKTKELWNEMNFYRKIVFLNIPYLTKPENGDLDFKLADSKINIVFAGSLSTRDPSYIISLFSLLRRKDVCVWFFTAEYYHNKLHALIPKEADCFVIHSYVPHGALQSILTNADFFLNIGVLNPNAISGKIFEYMSYGKPIISTYSIDDEACIPYLKKYGRSLLVDERKPPEENVSDLNKFIDECRTKPFSYEEVAALFPQNTPQAYAKLIEKYLNR